MSKKEDDMTALATQDQAARESRWTECLQALRDVGAQVLQEPAGNMRRVEFVPLAAGPKLVVWIEDYRITAWEGEVLDVHRRYLRADGLIGGE